MVEKVLAVVMKILKTGFSNLALENLYCSKLPFRNQCPNSENAGQFDQGLNDESR